MKHCLKEYEKRDKIQRVVFIYITEITNLKKK